MYYTHQVGLRALRRAITFIQQDAVLFAGSLRSNLDPFGEHSDATLEAALAEVDWPHLAFYSQPLTLAVALIS